MQTLYFNYSMNFITLIFVQRSSQPNFIAFQSQTPGACPHPAMAGRHHTQGKRSRQGHRKHYSVPERRCHHGTIRDFTSAHRRWCGQRTWHDHRGCSHQAHVPLRTGIPPIGSAHAHEHKFSWRTHGWLKVGSINSHRKVFWNYWHHTPLLPVSPCSLQPLKWGFCHYLPRINLIIHHFFWPSNIFIVLL